MSSLLQALTDIGGAFSTTDLVYIAKDQGGGVFVDRKADISRFDTRFATASPSYLTLALSGTLANERVLVGTANQITLTDGGANGNLTLSAPQDIHTAATPQFARIGLGAAADAFALIASSGQVAIQLNPFGVGPGNTGEIRFLELAAVGTNYTGFKAPDSVVASEIYALPNAAPSANRFLRGAAVGAGVSQMSWAMVDLTADVSGILPHGNLGPGGGGAVKFLREDSTWQTIPGGGDALTSSPLSQFASTTSAQLAGVISDETGSGALVFATSPSFVMPQLGDATATTLTVPNTGLHLLDTNASHDLIIAPGSDLTADRTLTITTGDANRTLTLTGAATISGTNSGDVTLAGTPDYITIAGQVITRGLIDLATDVSGLLPVANGGTGAGAFTQGSIIFAGVAGVYTQDNTNLFWDTTTSKLRIGSGSAPLSTLSVVGTVGYSFANIASLTGDVNDYSLGSSTSNRISSDATRTITGIAAGPSGRQLILSNVGSFDIILANQNSGSSAANRIITGTGADVTLRPDERIDLIYDDFSSRWRCAGHVFVAEDIMHDVLSSTHSDSLAASVVRGDLIVGNSTPKWSRFAVGAANRFLRSDGTDPSWAQVVLTTDVTGTLPEANGGTGITSFGAGIATFLGTPTSANLLAVVTDETGTGALVFATSPTLVTPALGTPTAIVLTSGTGLPLTTGVTGILPVANGGTATSTAFTQGSVVFAGAAGVYSQDNALFFWDDSNNRLGIGIAVPTVDLHVAGSALFATGTITLDEPISITQTWNASGVTFMGLLMNITNTASAAASLLVDIQKDAISRFKVGVDAFGYFHRQEADNSASGITIDKRGTVGDATAAIASGAPIGLLQVRGWDGAALGSAGDIRMTAVEAWSGTAHGSSMLFRVVNATTTTVSTVTTLTFNNWSLANNLVFSNTGFAGLRLNNLTTAQRDAISPTAASGNLIWNTTKVTNDVYDGTAWRTMSPLRYIGIVVSDETTAITTGTAKVTFRMPHAMTLVSTGVASTTGVRANVNTVSSSGTVTVDIKEGGVSILSTLLTIDVSEKTSTSAAAAAVISDTTLADDAEMTVDITVAGTGAKGLKVWLIGWIT